MKMKLQIYDGLGNKLNTYGKKRFNLPKIRKDKWIEIPEYVNTDGMDLNEEEY